MENQPLISEEDIFRYVLDINTLPIDKKEYIKANEQQFRESIDLLKASLLPLSKEDERMLRDKLSRRNLNPGSGTEDPK